MVLGTLVRFRLAWAAAQNLPGTVLRQRPSAEGCSIDGASHLAIPPLFVSERESQRQAGVDRPSQPASPYGPYLRGCSLVGQNYSSWKCAGQKIAVCDHEGKAMRYSCMPCNPVAVGVISTKRPNFRTVGLLHSSCLVVASSTKVSCGRNRARMTNTSRNGIGAKRS